MYNSIIETIIHNIFANTNDGILITPCFPKEIYPYSSDAFLKCHMNWDSGRMQEIAYDAEETALALEMLGQWYRSVGAEGLIYPDVPDCDPDDIDEVEVKESMVRVWKKYFDGFDPNTQDRQLLETQSVKRLGSEVMAPTTMDCFGRYLRSHMYNKREAEVIRELCNMVRAFVLNCACDKVEELKLFSTAGESTLTDSDMLEICDVLENDSTLMPTDIVGANLLASRIMSGLPGEKGFLGNELTECIFSLLETLEYLPRLVITERYGLGLEKGARRGHEEIARNLDISVEAVEALEARAMRVLRHPTRSDKLKSLLR